MALAAPSVLLSLRSALPLGSSKNNIYVAFHATFSRHAKAQASLALVIWLNENVLSVGHKSVS